MTANRDFENGNAGLRRSGASGESLRLLGAYQRLSEALGRSGGLSRYYLQSVEEASLALSTDRAVLCRIDDGNSGYLRVVAGTGPLARLEGAVLPAKGSFEGFVLAHEGVTAMTEMDVASEVFRTPEHRRHVGPAIGARLGEPHQPIGILMVARAPGGRPFSDEQGRLLGELSSVIGGGIQIIERYEAVRGGRQAVESWREDLAYRKWLSTYRDIFAERSEVAIRIGATGSIQWGPTVEYVLGRAYSPPETVAGLLALLPLEERAVVRSALRETMIGFGRSPLSLNCSLLTESEPPISVRLNVWKGANSAELIGVIEVVSPPDLSSPEWSREQLPEIHREGSPGLEDVWPLQPSRPRPDSPFPSAAKAREFWAGHFNDTSPPAPDHTPVDATANGISEPFTGADARGGSSPAQSEDRASNHVDYSADGSTVIHDQVEHALPPALTPPEEGQAGSGLMEDASAQAKMQTPQRAGGERVDALEAVASTRAPRVTESERNGTEPPSESITAELTDLHCHLVAGVDDGAVNEEESRTALERVYQAGVRHLIVTPHLRLSVLKTGEPIALTPAFDRLVTIAGEKYPDLKISRGAELMLDDPAMDLSSPTVRLAGTRFMLVEFSGFWVPPRSGQLLSRIVEAGYVPVVAHPERYENGTTREIVAWREVGARLQVNCGSLMGQYGPVARDRAWQLLSTSSVDYMASDYHARGAYPLEGCIRLLEASGGAVQAVNLLKVNPSRLAANLDPVDVAAVQRPPSLFRRIARGVLFR